MSIFLNIPTSQYNKLQSIQKEPMSLTLVQNTIGDKTFTTISHTTHIFGDNTQDCNVTNYQL
jgi:hypothetical protein